MELKNWFDALLELRGVAEKEDNEENTDVAWNRFKDADTCASEIMGLQRGYVGYGALLWNT